MIRKTLQMTRETAREVVLGVLEDYMHGDGESQPFGLIESACHANSVASGWWDQLGAVNAPADRNVGEMIMLIVTELAEAMEGYRRGLKDDKLTDRDMLEVELADAIIRIFDLAQACGYDLEGVILRKLSYNMQREDHQPENRSKAGGKKV